MHSIDYCKISTRQKSLEGETFANELAEIGACRDKWGNNVISCYKCELKFNIEKITEYMEKSNLSFIDAGWLIHTINHPWCDLLQTLPKTSLQKILGRIKLIL